jgi:CheY-like chemotaxis protein
MTSTDASAANRFRILVADNEPQVCSFVTQTISRWTDAGKVELFNATTEVEALDAFRDHFIDLILLDLHFSDGDLGGYTILQTLEELGCTANVIVMTHINLGRDTDRLIQSISRLRHAQVIDYVKKDQLESLLPGIIAELIADFDAKFVDLDNLDFAVQLISARRDRYSDSSLRASNEEVRVELERLCRDLFGSVEGSQRSTKVSVDLRRLDRRGLSAAVTLKPNVRLGIEDVSAESPGYDCVLKVGPVADIREELARYQEYVRYGVQLDQRVELLAATFRDSIGGIVYSFAGGVYNQALVSLDELLRQNRLLSSQVVKNLFSSVHWYSVSARPRPIRGYIDTSYKLDLAKSIDRNLASLRKIERKYPDVDLEIGAHGADSALQISGASQLTLPGERFLGEGWSLVSHPWCLVHGDMHGGNVMVELSNRPASGALDLGERVTEHVRRVCLIDYRNSGPGPRCIDATALESSIRIADAEAVVSRFGAEQAASLKGSDVLEAMRLAARRVDAERQLYQYLWGQRGQGPSAEWAGLAADVVGGLLTSFHGQVAQEEYLQTAMLYAIRQLAYPLDNVGRLRICAWIASHYALLRKTVSAK